MKFDLSCFNYSYEQPANLFRYQFLNQMNGDTLCVYESISLERVSLVEFINRLKEIIKFADPMCERVYVQGIGSRDYMIIGEINDSGRDHPRLLVQLTWNGDGDILDAEKSVFGLSITGYPDGVKAMLRKLRAEFPHRLAGVRWWYLVEGKLQCHDIVLSKPSPIKPEYYPFIDEDPHAYMRRFLEHPASLLFLTGPPGTGKTTLLRNFLYENRLQAVVTFEDALYNSDHMFVDFIKSTTHRVMIIEDADLMLGSREGTGNKMMSRFLNTSDGIVELKDKKMIFTTNMNSFKDIDEAIIRPGRSFDAVLFRELTPNEADAAAYAAQIPNWKTPDRDIYLSEVFHPRKQQKLGKRNIGFIQ